MSFLNESPLLPPSYPGYDSVGARLSESNLATLKSCCGRSWKKLNQERASVFLAFSALIMFSGLVISLVCLSECETKEGEIKCTQICSNGTKIVAGVLGIGGGFGTLCSMVSLQFGSRD